VKKQTILVTGGNGQLGSELQFLTQTDTTFEYIFTDFEDLDITNSKALNTFFAANKPVFCINCAAYTAVDKAETEKVLCNKINNLGAANLAKACEQHGATMIHVSTDYVYHNDKQNRPFVESDKTSPKGVYAKTKLAGDNAVLKANNSAIVIRTSWVYSTFGHNFVKTMMKLGSERNELNVIFDQIGSPTYARDLASCILSIINQLHSTKENLTGIYHFSNEGVTSWYDFACTIFDICKIECAVHPIETVQYPTPAARPPFSLLNKKKIKHVFGLHIRNWKDALVDCIQHL
jgi:dTDP-4-dehydrorhamnose reductase